MLPTAARPWPSDDGLSCSAAVSASPPSSAGGLPWDEREVRKLASATSGAGARSALMCFSDGTAIWRRGGRSSAKAQGSHYCLSTNYHLS